MTKKADKDVVKRGEEITYIITVCTSTPLENVIVRDVFDSYSDDRLEIVSVSPPWSERGVWNLGNLGNFETTHENPSCRTLILVVRVPKQDLEFGMVQGIEGEGFVRVANDYSTTFHTYNIKNCVYAVGNDTREGVSEENRTLVASDCTSTTVCDPGTELETREHGSGTYDSEELICLRTENKSISMNKDVSATYAPTTLGLYRNRTVTYDSKWIQKARAKNRVTGTSMYEAYHYATQLDRESRMMLDENESVMDVNAEFDGMGHICFLKKSDPNSTSRDAPIFEVREDYTGSFRVLEKIDEYGTSVTSDKEVTGQGLVAVDKQVKDNHGTYESGTGAYDVEEQIRTHTNYMAKDVSLVYAPASQGITDTYANWTLTHLAIGDKSVIQLRLNVTEYELGEYRYDELVNQVEACGGYNGGWVCARNFSAIEIDWLNCCLDDTMTVSKTGKLDPNEPNVVWYTVTIQNGADSTRVATVADQLPEGMVLLDSSPEFASYENDTNTITWDLIEIGPFETVTINYRVEALWSGWFANCVEVDARSLDGPVEPAVSAKSVVNVGEFSGEMTTAGWQLPDWDLQYPADVTCDEECVLAP